MHRGNGSSKDLWSVAGEEGATREGSC
jgi:hypothetical protein